MGDEHRHARGEDLLGRLHAETGAEVLGRLRQVAPDLAGHIVDFAYGEVWAAPGLALRDRQIATLAALAALGTAREELRVHVGAALRLGITPREVVAVMTQVAVYAGFPAALGGIAAAREAFEAAGVPLPLEGDGPASEDRRRGEAPPD